MVRALVQRNLFIRIFDMTRKQTLKAIIFIVLIGWMLLHLTYILRTNGDVKDRFVGFYAEKNDTIDAVVIGSSPVPMCFETPRIYGETGITMYPISSNMQRPVATKYLVEEVLKTQSPELFIFEMRMWGAEDENLLGNMAHTREVTDNLKYSVNRKRTIDAMVADPDERLTYYFDIFKYHSNWKTLFLWSQFRTLFYEYPEDLKGYLPETDVGPSDAPILVEESATKSIPPEQEEYLRDLLAYLKEKNINALFVTTPFAASEEEQMEINYMAQFIENEGYPFLDMNRHLDEIGLDFATDIRDYGTHTNVLGAQKVTDYLMKYLKENYVDTGVALTIDHRGDKKYKSWDKAYEKYESEIDAARSKALSNVTNGTYYELETDE